MERLVPNAVVAVDAVILTVADGAVMAALAPGAAGAPGGAMALPGVLLLQGESDSEGLARLVRTKLSGRFEGAFRRLGFSADPGRDPRGRVVSLTHAGILRVSGREAFAEGSGHVLCSVQRGEGRAEVRLDGRPVRVAYDHAAILQEALAWLRAELPRGTVTRDLLGDLFTLSELRAAYEAVFGVAVTQTAFDYHVRTKGLAERTALFAGPGFGRPASLFRPPASPPQHWEPIR